MDLVQITEPYYEFVRKLRMHPETRDGFLEDANITEEDQKAYMAKYGECYYVCLLDDAPVGYVGVIEDDIRICTSPDHQNKGVGEFMLMEIMEIFPESTGRIKRDNLSSQALFDKCEVPYVLL